MSDFSSVNESSNDDLALGHKVIGYALQVLAWGTTCAIAWSCSTVLMGIVMFIIMSIVMALLCGVLQLFIFFKVDRSTIESIGSTLNGVSTRVTGLFTRKATA
jgi:hypothetical protein